MSVDLLKKAQKEFTDGAREAINDMQGGQAVRKLVKKSFEDFTAEITKKLDVIASHLLQFESRITAKLDKIEEKLDAR